MCRKAIAYSRRGHNKGRVVVAQRFAQLMNRRGQRAFHYIQTGPDGFQELILGDYVPGVEKQLNQDLKWFQFKLDGSAVDAQFEPRLIEFPAGKRPRASRSVCQSRG